MLQKGQAKVELIILNPAPEYSEKLLYPLHLFFSKKSRDSKGLELNSNGLEMIISTLACPFFILPIFLPIHCTQIFFTIQKCVQSHKLARACGVPAVVARASSFGW